MGETARRNHGTDQGSGKKTLEGTSKEQAATAQFQILFGLLRPRKTGSNELANQKQGVNKFLQDFLRPANKTPIQKLPSNTEAENPHLTAKQIQAFDAIKSKLRGLAEKAKALPDQDQRASHIKVIAAMTGLLQKDHNDVSKGEFDSLLASYRQLQLDLSG